MCGWSGSWRREHYGKSPAQINDEELRQYFLYLQNERQFSSSSCRVVLSVKEVQQILGRVQKPAYRLCLSTIYSCGLRLLEGVRLQVKQIDSERQVLHLRQAKGHKDRLAPLPGRTLAMLRRY